MDTGADTFKGNHKKWARELRHAKERNQGCRVAGFGWLREPHSTGKTKQTKKTKAAGQKSSDSPAPIASYTCGFGFIGFQNNSYL